LRAAARLGRVWQVRLGGEAQPGKTNAFTICVIVS
jgi:hypothetical protein